MLNTEKFINRVIRDSYHNKWGYHSDIQYSLIGFKFSLTYTNSFFQFQGLQTYDYFFCSFISCQVMFTFVIFHQFENVKHIWDPRSWFALIRVFLMTMQVVTA